MLSLLPIKIKCMIRYIVSFLIRETINFNSKIVKYYIFKYTFTIDQYICCRFRLAQFNFFSYEVLFFNSNCSNKMLPVVNIICSTVGFFLNILFQTK